MVDELVTWIHVMESQGLYKGSHGSTTPSGPIESQATSPAPKCTRHFSLGEPPLPTTSILWNSTLVNPQHPAGSCSLGIPPHPRPRDEDASLPEGPLSTAWVTTASWPQVPGACTWDVSPGGRRRGAQAGSCRGRPYGFAQCRWDYAGWSSRWCWGSCSGERCLEIGWVKRVALDLSKLPCISGTQFLETRTQETMS